MSSKRGASKAKRGDLLWHAFVDAKWAITEPIFRMMQRVLSDRRAGTAVTEHELSAARAIREQRDQQAVARREMAAASGNVYVIPVYGVITQRASLMTEYSGGCSVEELVDEVREAMAMPSVSAVVLDFDSPGGSVFGVPEAFDALKAMRGAKPLVAFCDPLAASAAYWLACACEAIYCTPSGEAGSVGVYLSHTDYSGMNAQLGIDVTYISAGRYKVEGNSDAPLSDDAKAYYQSQVDDTYAEFIADVAEGRGVSTKEVIAQYGEGRCLLAKDALAAGMIDDVCTFDQLIAQLTAPAAGKKGARRGQARRADHTDVGRGDNGQFATQCECDLTCECMRSGSSMCPPDCETCRPGCACITVVDDDADDATGKARARQGARFAGVVPADVSESLAPKDAAWSKPSLGDFGKGDDWASMSDADKKHICGHYAWAPKVPPDSFGELELPHHQAKDGKVVFRGVTAAAGRLDQAAIPSEDKPKVRAHLEKHYHQFDEKAPWESDDKESQAAERDQVAVSASAMNMEVRRSMPRQIPK